MRTVLLLTALLASALAYNYPWPDCYAKTTTRCSSTEPAVGTWSTISYCPTRSLWLSIPCASYPSAILDNHCNAGYLWAPNTLGNPLCNLQRDVEAVESSESNLEERVLTFTNCPISGSPKVVCCPNPNTCHVGISPPLVCY